jgi:hypothetical protein
VWIDGKRLREPNLESSRRDVLTVRPRGAGPRERYVLGDNRAAIVPLA